MSLEQYNVPFEIIQTRTGNARAQEAAAAVTKVSLDVWAHSDEEARYLGRVWVDAFIRRV